MMGFKKLAEKISPYYYQIVAEEAFQTAAVTLASSLTPQHLAYMAEHEVTLSQAMKQLGFDTDDLSAVPPKTSEYLLGCTDEYLLGLMEKYIPEHVVVIKSYPGFAESIITDLRTIIGGSNGRNGSTG